MAKNFNCPHCGATNKYPGAGDTVRCAYCGSDVRPPEEMVNQAALARFGSKAKVWIILFVVVVFILPTCIGLGGTIIGIAASILGALAAFFASFSGH
jgi:hypothetical protein